VNEYSDSRYLNILIGRVPIGISNDNIALEKVHVGHNKTCPKASANCRVSA